MASNQTEVVIFDSVITAWSLPGGMVWRWGFQKARRTSTLAKAYAPKRSGRMAAGIEAEYEGSERDSATMRVSAPSPALYVHEGTNPYGPGDPVQAQGTFMYLRPGGGYGLRRARRVDGQHPQPFLMDALEDVIRTL